MIAFLGNDIQKTKRFFAETPCVCPFRLRLTNHEGFVQRNFNSKKKHLSKLQGSLCHVFLCVDMLRYCESFGSFVFLSTRKCFGKFPKARGGFAAGFKRNFSMLHLSAESEPLEGHSPRLCFTFLCDDTQRIICFFDEVPCVRFFRVSLTVHEGFIQGNFSKKKNGKIKKDSLTVRNIEGLLTPPERVSINNVFLVGWGAIMLDDSKS